MTLIRVSITWGVTIVIRIWSSFSKVGVANLFAHMYILSDFYSSFRFKPSIMVLNKKCHLGL
jgi:hypothetical protein